MEELQIGLKKAFEITQFNRNNDNKNSTQQLQSEVNLNLQKSIDGIEFMNKGKDRQDLILLNSIKNAFSLRLLQPKQID